MMISCDIMKIRCIRASEDYDATRWSQRSDGPTSREKDNQLVQKTVGEQDSIENVYGDDQSQPNYVYRDASNSSGEDSIGGGNHRQ